MEIISSEPLAMYTKSTPKGDIPKTSLMEEYYGNSADGSESGQFLHLSEQ